MVTNFTFLPEELLDDIVKYGINLTVSIDGPKEITNEQRISRTQNMDVYDTIVKNLNRLRKRGRDVSAIECTCTDLYKKLGYTEQTLKKFFHEELSVENIMLETENDIYGSDEKLINNEMYFKENLSFSSSVNSIISTFTNFSFCFLSSIISFSFYILSLFYINAFIFHIIIDSL